MIVSSPITPSNDAQFPNVYTWRKIKAFQLTRSNFPEGTVEFSSEGVKRKRGTGGNCKTKE